MYIIRKTTTDASIIYMEYDDNAYPLKTNSKKISNIYVYNKKFIPRVNNQIPFEYVFNDLANVIFNLLYNNTDDTDDGDITILLGEVEKLRSSLELEYKEFMKRQDYYAYVDKLTFLRDELLNRRKINKYRQNINTIISGRSR
jgi:hypothetical protein